MVCKLSRDGDKVAGHDSWFAKKGAQTIADPGLKELIGY